MKSKQFLVFALGIILIPLAVQGYDVNKDLQNSGTTAYDIAVVLDAPEVVTDHFDGYGDGYFHSFTLSSEPGTGNTVMHWQAFDDGGNGAIDNGQVIHVGWSTQDHTSNVKDMYWTDQNGNRILGSAVINVTPDYGRPAAGNNVGVTFRNNFRGETTIRIRNVNQRVRPIAEPLSELNLRNGQLNTELTPVPGAQVLDIPPGGSRTIFIQNVPPNYAVVLRYEVSAVGTDAVAVDFVQFIAE